MIKNLFKKQREKVQQANMLVLTPVYSTNIVSGSIYKVGEFVPHARMRVIFEDSNMLYGTCYKKEETLFFVATDREVMEHIKKQGSVPLVQSRHLRIFNEKKRMQAHVQKIQSNPLTA